MNTMNMPGFTAEASLGKSGKFCRSTPTYTSESFGISGDSIAVVQPQLRRTDYECVHDCFEAGGPADICNFFCTEIVEDGGGRGEQHCLPACTPCGRDPESRTGRSRTCIDFHCNDHIR